MKFVDYISWLNENALTSTYWENKGIRLTLKDVLSYLDKNDIKSEYINPKELKKILIDTERDEERVNKSNLRYPVIVTRQNNKFISILDGNHRVEKALKNNVNKIKVRVLDLDNAPEEYKKVFYT